MVARLADNTALRIFTTNIPTKYKVKTLLSDNVYRGSVDAQPSAYDGPPYTGMYMNPVAMISDKSTYQITREPLKKSYVKGEKLDLTGLVVSGTLDTGIADEIKLYEVSGFDCEKVGVQTVNVSVEGEVIDSFDVEVHEKGSVYLSEDFDNYTGMSITMKRQNTQEQSQSLGEMELGIGFRSVTADNTSGFNITTNEQGKKLTIISGKYANAQRGAYFAVPNSDLPKFTDLGEGEKLVFNFDTYFYDENSNIQLFGITSSDTGKTGTAVYDPYLSAVNNSDIPVGEWINVKAEIDNAKNVKLCVVDMDGNILSEKEFTASGEEFEKFAFYGGVSAVDIDNLSVYTTDSVESITLSAKPSKQVYPLNSELDLTGMVVNAKYSSGEERVVTDYTVSGFDSTKLGVQTVTVDYRGKIATFDVEVKDLVIGIEVTKTPDKTRYAVGEELDLTGLVVSNVYSSGIREEITDFAVSGYDNAKTGLQKLTVTSGEFETVLNINIPADEIKVYYNDDFNSYDASTITMKKQQTEAQSQDLGMLDLEIGYRAKLADGQSGFDVIAENGNSYLKMSSGRWASIKRGASFTFDELCEIPPYTELDDGKALYITFDMMLCDSKSTMTIDGVTDTASTDDTIVNDVYLSAQNTALPQKEWVNVIIAADNQKNAVISMKDMNGNILQSSEYTLPESGIEEMKFTFYGSSVSTTEASVVCLDNLKVYEDYFVKALEVDNTTVIKCENLNLKVKAVYSDGTAEIIDDYKVSAYDTDVVGKQQITVSYGAKDAVVEIEVVEMAINVDMNGNSVTANIVNNTDNAVLILAVYDENDVMKSVMIKDVKADEKAVFENVESGQRYRIFAWDSVESMIPMIRPEEI